MLKKLRPYLIGVAAGAMLMLGGQALADIPDATPSSPDPSHTLYLCVANNPQPYKTVYVLDKSQGNCPTGTTEKYVVPAIPA